jgi:hypothetical protein
MIWKPGEAVLSCAGVEAEREQYSVSGPAMPTIKDISGPYRFFFYSFDCNEPMHVHVQRENKVCKFWIEPVELAKNQGFSARELNQIRRVIELNVSGIKGAWHEHCDQR